LIPIVVHQGGTSDCSLASTAPRRGATRSCSGKDGDRATVIVAYHDHYLPFKPSLLARLGELRGKALGCWWAPEACHEDVLATAAEAKGAASTGAVVVPTCAHRGDGAADAW
jgi:hypothetical protein